MALRVPPIRNGQPSNPVPSGTHRAVLTCVVDLGHQDGTSFSGEPEIQHRVQLIFELPDERYDDGRPRTVSKEFKLSMHEKSGLRACVHSLVGKKLTDAEAMQADLAGLIGRNCLIEIVEQTRRDGNGTYSKVEKFSALMRGMQPAEPEGDCIAYEIEQGEPPAELPEWVRNKINASRERGGAKSPATATMPAPPRWSPADADEAPF